MIDTPESSRASEENAAPAAGAHGEKSLFQSFLPDLRTAFFIAVALALILILAVAGHALLEDVLANPLTAGVAFVYTLVVVFLSLAVTPSVIRLFSKYLMSRPRVDTELKKLADQLQNLGGHVGSIDGHARALDNKLAGLDKISNEISLSVSRIRFFAGAVELTTPQAAFKFVQSLLLLPSQYTSLISNLRSDPAPLPVKELTIIGSMVGFSLTIAGELAEALAQENKPFTRLKLIAPIGKTSDMGRASDLVYPVWNFQLLVLEEFIKRLSLASAWEIQVSSCYVPFDLLAAAIFVPQRYVVALQALSADVLGALVKEHGYLVGIKFSGTGDDTSVYDRYVNTIERHLESPYVCKDSIIFQSRADRLIIKSSGLVMPHPETDEAAHLNAELADKAVTDATRLQSKSWEMTRGDFESTGRDSLITKLRESRARLAAMSSDVTKIQNALTLAQKT